MAPAAELCALIGAGGNLGSGSDIAARFLAAERALCTHLCTHLATDWPDCAPLVRTRWSPVYWSAPQGPVRDQPRFLNAVLAVESGASLDPVALLAALLDIETRLGRVRPAPVAWGPRAIDLDLLFAGDECAGSAERPAGPDGPALHLPHPRAAGRAFVLQPLADLMGDGWRLPGLGRTIAACLADPDVAGQRSTLTRAADSPAQV